LEKILKIQKSFTSIWDNFDDLKIPPLEKNMIKKVLKGCWKYDV